MALPDLVREQPRIGAFFDMDKTLLADNSGSLYMKYRYQRGEISGFTGGYELGISFPPDWVGWWSFSVGEEDTNDWIIQERQVFNFESYSTGSTALIDTFVHETDRCRRLSMTPADLLVVA